MAQIDDADLLAGVELALQLFGLEARGNEVLEHHPAANKRPMKNAYDAQNQQRAREAADPVEHAGIALEQVAEEPAAGQNANPGNGADAVVEQERAKPHAVLAGDGRSQRCQAGNELGEHEHGAAAAAKRVLRAANAGGRLQRKLAEQAQHDGPACAR
jgi:hypothetical protein